MSKMVRIISLLLVPLLITLGIMTLHGDGVLAQSPTYWSKTYGGADQDRAMCVDQTSDGGIIVAGYTESFGAGDEDIWIVKLDSNGNVEWQKTYGGSDVERARSIQQTTDDGYIVAGFTESFGAGVVDCWLLKLDSNGNVEWQKTYGGNDGDLARCVKQTSDGGYIVAGSTESFGAGEGDFWILKLTSTGDVEWQKSCGGSNWDVSHSVQQTSDGGYIVAGYTESFGAGEDDIWIVKFASNGNFEWQKTYGGSSWDGAYSIQQTADGGYIAAGYTGSFGAGDDDFWVLKLASNGTVEWQKTYGSASWEFAISIQQTSDDGYIVTGETGSFGAGEGDIWLIKLASTGNAQWQKTYGGGTWEDVDSVMETSDGGFVVAGATESFGAGSDDLWVLRLNENGSIPECSLVMDSNITEMDTQSTVGDTTSTISDTVASVTIPIHWVSVSGCITNTQCYYSSTVPMETWDCPLGGVTLIAPYPIQGRPLLTVVVDPAQITVSAGASLWGIYYLDETTGEWLYFIPGFTGSTLTQLEPDEFYLVVVSGSCTLSVPQ
ncbi:hypothetical protein ACFLTV_02270 [Chloroflexota bacterium]